MYIEDQKQEYNRMYNYVMRNSSKKLIKQDEIIEYLVTQCYFIDTYNDELEDIISKIRSALGIKNNEEPNEITITSDDLPF